MDISDIDIRESEQLGLTDQERKAIFDMHCETTDGHSFIIEVQLADQPHFLERAIFYTSRTISHKALSGDWNYDFKPVFFLGFLNFDIRHLEPEKANPAQFIHKFSLREDETHEQMSRVLRFAFLEVARFDKAKEECETFEERFLWIMKNLPTFAGKLELWNDPYFDDFMEQADFASMTWEEQEAYITSMKHKWDYKNTIDFAEAKGETTRAIKTARKMLEDHEPIEKIMRYTDLSEKEIRAL